MYNVTQAGALVVVILAIVILCTHFSHNIIFPLPRFVGVDDIPQHQHIVRRLARPRVGFGVHARTDAAHERLELLGLEWRIVVDAFDHVRREYVFDGPLEERRTLRKAALVALIDLDLVAIELDEVQAGGAARSWTSRCLE